MSMRRRRASHGSWSAVPIAGRTSRRRRLAIIIEFPHASRHGSTCPEDTIFVVNDNPSSLAGVAGMPAELLLMLLAALTAMSRASGSRQDTCRVVPRRCSMQVLTWTWSAHHPSAIISALRLAQLPPNDQVGLGQVFQTGFVLALLLGRAGRGRRRRVVRRSGLDDDVLSKILAAPVLLLAAALLGRRPAPAGGGRDVLGGTGLGKVLLEKMDELFAQRAKVLGWTGTAASSGAAAATSAAAATAAAVGVRLLGRRATATATAGGGRIIRRGQFRYHRGLSLLLVLYRPAARGFASGRRGACFCRRSCRCLSRAAHASTSPDGSGVGVASVVLISRRRRSGPTEAAAATSGSAEAAASLPSRFCVVMIKVEPGR